MLARVHSCAVIGLDGVVVAEEVDYTSGFPGITIVGLQDVAIQESRERILAAVRNAAVSLSHESDWWSTLPLSWSARMVLSTTCQLLWVFRSSRACCPPKLQRGS
jgi:Subunit ChlI of Mg-chelatase